MGKGRKRRMTRNRLHHAPMVIGEIVQQFGTAGGHTEYLVLPYPNTDRCRGGLGVLAVCPPACKRAIFSG
jgi:hypothetical protein